MGWTEAEMPDLANKTYVVTGANSGLGYWTTYHLAKRGATVVMACRSQERAASAMDKLNDALDRPNIVFEALDLADLNRGEASIERFSEAVGKRYPRLDGVVANAGIMAIPYQTTQDGFEMQLGTNHLGHFALIGRLFPCLQEVSGARVVVVSSEAYRIGRIDFDDLDGKAHYGPWRAYGQSKLANLLYVHELAKRARQASIEIRAAAAHPGYAATNLQMVAPTMNRSRIGAWIHQVGHRVAQSAEMGAMPSLYAATAPDVESGAFYGPRGFARLWGYPVRERVLPVATNDEVAQRLWDVSEQQTKVAYPI